MPPGVVTQSPLVGPTSSFSSSGLSLALQTSMERKDAVKRAIEQYNEGNNNNNNNNNVSLSNNKKGVVGKRRSREDDSRSESDNLEGASGDDQDIADLPPKKKRNYRHTPQQIQLLESVFKECPHPDEKQRLELSKKLRLEIKQVKFWFQNRRTLMKAQSERHENSILRHENDKLRGENMSIREAMRNPMCTNCGGPVIMGDISMEEQHLRIENARLKDELDRVCSLASKFLGRPMSSISTLSGLIGPPMPNSALELGVGTIGFSSLSTVSSTLPLAQEFGSGISNTLHTLAPTKSTANVAGIERSLDRSMLLDVALSAMDELVKMAQTDEPIWLRSMDSGGREILNLDEYRRSFNPSNDMKSYGVISEASRETGMIIINSLALVETFMDANRWAEMFPGMVARASTTDLISIGMEGTRNGALQLMHAELQVLSPLVPVRVVKFLRFCKQHADGVWAVVDVSIDCIRESSGSPTYANCRRLPSGCVIEDMPNGYSKVTWIEHAEYNDNSIHQLYKPLISAGMGFGAQRWIATLKRQCECLAILMSSTVPSGEHTAITANGRRSMLKLAQRMTNNFCVGVCASSVHQWNKLDMGNIDQDVHVMTRKSVNDPGEPPGIILSTATSVWLPASPQSVFDFLRDEHTRSEWDILSNGGPMQEMVHIAKGQDQGNCVSLLRTGATDRNQSSMLILQETCTDASGSLIVYAPVDIPAMHVVMNGGDSAYVALLPSGFSIIPDGPSPRGSNNNNQHPGPHREGGSDGSLLTVAFQILVNNLPTAKITVESVETVNNLISCTVQKIKAALHCEN